MSSRRHASTTTTTTAAASALRFAATGAFMVDCRVKLLGVGLEEGVWPARRWARRTASCRVEAARQSADHENILVLTSLVLKNARR